MTQPYTNNQTKPMALSHRSQEMGERESERERERLIAEREQVE